MKVLQSVINLLWPNRCALCGRIVPADRPPLCISCGRELKSCGQVLELGEEASLPCAAPLSYEGALQEAFHRYKFGGKDCYARLFGPMTAAGARMLPGKYDLVTWAPLGRKRLKQRGYDQARMLAEYTAEALKLPLVPLLEKYRENPAQSGSTSKEARTKNVQNVYRLKPGAEVKGKRVLLVDDIVTTGSTLRSCGAVLYEAGAESVGCAVLAERELIIDH